jgi:DNA recombination protein RmuC
MYDQLRHIKEELRESTRTIDGKLLEQNRDMNANVKFQFNKSQELISDITEKLVKVNESVTEVKEGNKQVLTMTDQLSNLEKVLTNQKQRGNWGESSLELILSNVINGNYSMQHYFENGEAVDAVVHIKDKMLPIDSKFSLDNYQRCVDADNDEDRKYYAEEFKKDLKLRITETAKYIREKENTLPIAFMFIPSEAIYYDLLAGENSRIKVNTQKLIEYAQGQKVFIVSPTSILAYLHLVLSGIKAFTIEESAKQIQKKVEELGKHINSYEESYKKLGNTLSTTVNHYNSGYKELKKIDKDVYKITDGVQGGDMEIDLLDKPSQEEE